MMMPEYISNDKDPFDYVGPLLYDDTSSGREASTTSALGHRVSSRVSDEITPREVTARAPSPIRNACNDTVDERIHEIHYVSCGRPDIQCCRAVHYDYDWLDSFEDEPLLGCLFGIVQQEGAKFFSEPDGTSSNSILPSDQAIERNSIDLLGNSVSDCQKVGHAGMNPTGEVTHEDTVHHPDEDYLPCESKLPNIHSSGALQTGLSGSTRNGDSTCKKKIEERTNQSKNMRSRAVGSENVNSQEISKESIRIEQAKDHIELEEKW